MATKTKTASSPPAGDDKGEPVFGKQETILVTGEGSPRGGDETSKTFPFKTECIPRLHPEHAPIHGAWLGA